MRIIVASDEFLLRLTDTKSLSVRWEKSRPCESDESRDGHGSGGPAGWVGLGRVEISGMQYAILQFLWCFWSKLL